MTELLNRRRQGGQVLIMLFLGALLFGASAAGLGTVFSKQSVKKIRAELKTIVPEPARRKALDASLDQLLTENEKLADAHREQGKRLLELMASHDAAPAAFDALTAQADALNLEARQRLLALRFELRSKLSAEEWRRLFRAADVR
jgi:hypothetical protein